MRFVFRVFLSFTSVVILAGASVAEAQSAPWGEISVSAGRVDYDLSGVGNTPGFAVRARRDLTPHVSLELRSLFAQPPQQGGPATLVVPEAQLQYRWRMARFEPFVGAGFGVAALRSSGSTAWDPTVAFSAGTGIRLSDHVAATGEFRLRGHELRFTGTTTEILAGLSWRLSPF